MEIAYYFNHRTTTVALLYETKIPWVFFLGGAIGDSFFLVNVPRFMYLFCTSYTSAIIHSYMCIISPPTCSPWLCCHWHFWLQPLPSHLLSLMAITTSYFSPDHGCSFSWIKLLFLLEVKFLLSSDNEVASFMIWCSIQSNILEFLSWAVLGGNNCLSYNTSSNLRHLIAYLAMMFLSLPIHLKLLWRFAEDGPHSWYVNVDGCRIGTMSSVEYCSCYCSMD